MSGAGVRFDVEYDDREVRAALVRLIARMDDPRPVHGRDRAEAGHERDPPLRERVRAGRDAVEALAASARGERPDADGHRAAPGQHHAPASRDEVLVGTNVVYAAIHQFGGRTSARTIRPLGKKALFWPGAAHPVAKVEHPGSTVTARPFLGVNGGDRDAILRILARHLAGAVS